MKKLMKIISIMILSAFMINSCSGGGWPKADKKAFLDNCVSEASRNMASSQAKKYCNCVLDDLMDDYDNPEDALNADLYSYALKCL